MTATDAEVAPLIASLTPVPGRSLRLKSFTHETQSVDVLTTGVGSVATATWCSGVFARERYDLVLNAGVCGSFRPALPPGHVIHVTTDRLARAYERIIADEEGNVVVLAKGEVRTRSGQT